MSEADETDLEKSSIGGAAKYKIGTASYMKYYDNTSEKWERWSGSGAPFVKLIGGISQFPEQVSEIDFGYVGSDLTTLTYKDVGGSTLFTLTLSWSGGNPVSIIRS